MTAPKAKVMPETEIISSPPKTLGLSCLLFSHVTWQPY